MRALKWQNYQKIKKLFLQLITKIIPLINLVDNREKGYILSAAFFAFAANEGLDKQQVIEMVNSHYDQFTGDDDSSLFKRL